MRSFVMWVLLLCAISPTALAWEDGIYRDKAPGYGGDVIVTAVIRGGQIRSLTTQNTAGDKSEYYLRAEEALRTAILEANGTDGVDAVAGATGTSESILTAMQGILEQASYTGPSARSLMPTYLQRPSLRLWRHAPIPQG